MGQSLVCAILAQNFKVILCKVLRFVNKVFVENMRLADFKRAEDYSTHRHLERFAKLHFFLHFGGFGAGSRPK